MKRVAYATGSRADYGIVRKLLRYLNDDRQIELDILATGAMLDDRYGRPLSLVRSDGFNVGVMINIALNSSSNSSILHSMAIALDEFGAFFESNKYDLLIILGDRYEMLSVAESAAMQRIPILHIHGGEATYGNYDEFIRHSITKMSQYHFVATDDYRRRVVQLGESPDRVFSLGALGAENCQTIDLDNVSKEIKELQNEKYFVVLFHPETLTDKKVSEQTQIVLSAVDDYIDEYKFVFIGSNADTGSDDARAMVKTYVNENRNQSFYFENLHPDAYHYAVKNSLGLIGNSSSGIIEAPSLGVMSINIGDRQKGRICGNSVIDVPCDRARIASAIREITKNKKGISIYNPYYKDGASRRYYETIKELLERNNAAVVKEFYDL